MAANDMKGGCRLRSSDKDMPRRHQNGIDSAADALLAPTALLSSQSITTDRHWRLGVISNPLSGSNQRKFPAICRYIDRQPHLPHRIVTNAEEVVTALEDLARREINLIAINAGDGTVQAALTALLHHRPYQTLPLLALLCGGTTNMTARDLGSRGSRIRSLERIQAWSHSGRGNARIVRRPILRVRHPAGHAPYYGLFFGAASIYRGIRLFHSRIHGLGLQGNPANALIIARYLAAIAARNFDELGAAQATITVDGTPLGTERFMLIMTHTLEQLIFGMRPHWGNEEGALRLTAVTAAPKFTLRVMAALCQCRRSRLAIPENGFYSHNAHEIRMALDGGFAVDGELFQAESRQGDLILDAGGQAAFLRLIP
jgi:hypothetical protein